MIVNGISVDMALMACSLQATVPASTIYSRVKTRREKGTYNALILKRVQEARQVGLIIDITNIRRWVLLTINLDGITYHVMTCDQEVVTIYGMHITNMLTQQIFIT